MIVSLKRRDYQLAHHSLMMKLRQWTKSARILQLLDHPATLPAAFC